MSTAIAASAALTAIVDELEVDPDERDLAAILATIPDPGVRRQAATKAALDRRAQLVTYGLVYAETYGHKLSLDRLLDDALLIRLLTLADA